MDRSSVRLDRLVHDRGVVCGNDIGDAITADRRQRVVDRLTILITEAGRVFCTDHRKCDSDGAGSGPGILSEDDG